MNRIRRVLRRPRLLVALGALALVLIARPFAGHLLTRVFFAPHPGPASPPPEAPAAEEIVFAARDGSRLEGWWVGSSAPDGSTHGVILFAHGNGWNLEKQWHVAARLAPGGYDVLLFDYRGFGDSEGRVSRRHAREDVLSALAVARERATSRGVPLFAAGQSMGAALLLENVGELDGVTAVIADAPFSSWSEVAAWQVAKHRWSRVIVRGALASILSATGRDPLDAVKGSRLPMLVIGGTKDVVTPPHMAREVAAAAGAELLMLDGAGHPGRRSDEVEARVADAELAFLRKATPGRM